MEGGALLGLEAFQVPLDRNLGVPLRKHLAEQHLGMQRPDPVGLVPQLAVGSLHLPRPCRLPVQRLLSVDLQDAVTMRVKFISASPEAGHLNNDLFMWLLYATDFQQ